jgi:glycerophosphoryl diester phosphodiesterase
MHDQTLDRTTDGRGAASALTMAQLRRLDAGAWFDERFRGEKVPTLAEALAVAKGRGRLLLDVKDAGMGRAIRRALRKASVGPEAVWLEQNVSREALDNFRRHIPGAEILWMSLPADEREFAELKERGVAGFELEFGKFTKEFVDRAHGHGLKVYTYTLFNERSLLRALELGVDGFETDYPDRFDEWMPPRN